MKKRILAWTLAASMLAGILPADAVAAAGNTAPAAPTGLMLELSKEPLGVEAKAPLLSWIVNDTDPDEIQTAYRILVATGQDKLMEGEADVWDSGKVVSGENTNVPYGGAALSADNIFYWTVKTWDKDGAESPYAQPQFFSTAVKDNWDADAIWYDAKATELFQQVGLADYTLESNFTITETALGFTVRKSSNTTAEDNGFLVQIRVGSGTQTVVKTQGLGTNIGSKIINTTANACGVSIEADKSYHLKISAAGTTLKVWIDGTLVVERTDFLENACGTFGVRCGNSESGYLEDLKVTGADGKVYLQHDFSDGTVSPFGNGGTIENGKLTVGKGNKLYHVAEYPPNPGQWTDYVVECDFQVSTAALGFIVRKKDLSTTQNGFMVQVSAGSGASQVVKIQQLSVGTGISKPVSANAAGISIEAGKTYHLKISAVGTELKVWINGTPVVTTQLRPESPTFLTDAAGTVGIRCGNTESGYVDNYRVSAPDGRVYLYSDFTTAADNVFSSGGAISDGRLYMAKAAKIYYLRENSFQEHKGNAVFLRKEFSVNKPVEKAIVSAIGKSRAETLQYVFKMYVNGNFAGLGSPRSFALTANAKWNFYNTFDVTNLIVQGENCIGVTAYTPSDQRFQARLKLFYTDGTTAVISTDESWMALDGTAAFGDNGGSVGSAIYSLVQENIDARVYPFGYAKPGFDASGWTPVLVKKTITDLQASPTENMKEFVMPAETVVDKGNGNYFIRLEKEIVGGLRLRIPNGTAGTKLTVLYGEELESENTVKWKMRTGNQYKEVWTLKDGEQVIEHWGMRNLRYIEIQNCPFAITMDMVEGIAQRQEFDDEDAYLESSDPLLDEIFEFMKYSIKATNQDMYVDSQARERGRADGDIYINQLTSFGVSRNYTLSHRTSEYALASISVWSEYNKFIVINAWEDYLHTGDKTLLEVYYDEMVDNLFLEQQDDTGLYQDDKRSLVDWPAVERTGYDVTNSYYNTVVNAFQYKALLTMVEIAELLGKTEDAALFASEAEKLKAAVNGKFYDVNGNGLYIEGMQADGTLCAGNAIHATLYPLLFGMVDDEAARVSLARYLADTGLIGSVYFSQFYLEALYKNGQADAAMEILTGNGTKSWYHMLYELDATISCEAWDPTIKPNMTFSHPWGAAAGNIIVRHTFGVQPLEAGFGKLQIKPQLGSLEYGTLKTPTIKGAVTVSVQSPGNAGRFAMTTTTPANTTAMVYVPVSDSDIDILLVDGEAVQAQRDGDFLVVEVGSGTHSFTLPGGFAMVAADGTETVVADPFAAWSTGKYAYIKLYEDVETVVNLQGTEVVIDLNGCNLTVTGSGKLAAFDSANDGYDASACGAITNSGTVELQTDVTAPNGNRYLAVTVDGKTTMHRLDMELTCVTLRTAKAGIYYKATATCDDALRQRIASCGIAVSVVQMPTAAFETEEYTAYTSISGMPEGIFTSGSVTNIFREGLAAEKNTARGEMKIYAKPYLKLHGGTVLMAQEGAAYSLYDVMSYLNTNFETLEAQTQENAKNFYSTWADAMAPWKLENLAP